MEMKLVQDLASVNQNPLVFLYLKKSYDAVDCGRLLKTLEVYGAGPHMFRLLAVF